MYQNRISLIGFVGNDVQLKSTKNGTPVAVLSVATKSSWKNGKGEYDSRTEWHRCTAWDKLAEFASKLEKGASYPGLEIIAKLATVLEVEPAELLRMPAEWRDRR